ncbi:uncharacterized protein LOC119784851 [Cyprinodon tularosa]|uniref:uncharacterized protein LOC119784851 n=1 Tax=Cyprinodon tularosa TaxID=77115 RepID=UPI0018E243A6|nr:uncharacterized protein LOC119784851 [Cyprinodon tularosa]
MKKQARGEQTPQRGHFELVGADGSVIPVYSEGQNCLYHAVVQATQRTPSDLNQQALALRAQVQRTLQQDVQRYAPALRLQRQYEQTLAARSCYTISGGAKKDRDQITEAYQQMLNKIRISNPQLYQLMKTYKLGLVGAYHDVIGVRRESGSPNNNGDPVMNADHIPPRDCLQKAYDILQQKGMTEAFRTEHPALYEIMVGKDKQLCREVLAQHHRMALTTGNSREARSTRAEITNALVSGDSVKLMKMSLLLSNPEVSESLRRDAGISRKQVMGNYLSREEIQAYHQVGDQLLLDGYSASGLFTNNQREELQDWLDRGQLYSKETAEYKQLLAAIGDGNNKKQPKKGISKSKTGLSVSGHLPRPTGVQGDRSRNRKKSIDTNVNCQLAPQAAPSRKQTARTHVLDQDPFVYTQRPTARLTELCCVAAQGACPYRRNLRRKRRGGHAGVG